jgi:hypothetical protein
VKLGGSVGTCIGRAFPTGVDSRSLVVTDPPCGYRRRATPEKGRIFPDMTESRSGRTTTWTSDELARVGAAEELQIASLRRDGTLGSPRTIWVVPYGDDLYVRSVNGPAADWFRGTRVRHEGHIRAGGVDKDVAFVDADHSINDPIDAAYRTKYRRYAKSITDSINSPGARSTTIKLVPRSSGS